MQFYHTFCIDYEDFALINAQTRITFIISFPVSETRIKWLVLCWKQILYFFKTPNFEDVRLFDYDFHEERLGEPFRA